MKNLFKAILPILFSGILVGCNFSLAADVTPPPGYQAPVEVKTTVEATSGPVYPLVAADPAQGEQIYREKCAPCHGARGLGDGPQAGELPNPVPALASAEIGRQAVPSNWFTLVTKGNLEKFMPPFQSLTTKQRWDVVAYALSLSTPSNVLAEGESLYLSACANCHGATGKGDGPVSAGLAVSPSDFSNQQMMAEKSQNNFFHTISAGVDPTMPGFAADYSEEQRWALAAYVRSLSFASTDLRAAEAPAATEAIPPGTSAPPVADTPAAQATALDAQSTAVSAAAAAEGANQAVNLGSVSGKIIDETGVINRQSLEVVLHGFDQMSVILTETVSVAADGTYAFKDIEMPDGRIFLATVDYDGVTYGSEVATAGGETQDFDLPIEVFATSTDSTVLTVDRLHYFFDFLDAETLRVVELYVISNPTQKTITAATENGPVLSFSLPEKAINLEFQDGELGNRYLLTDGGFSDTIPVRPGAGNYQVLVSYELPFSKKIELSRKMLLETNAVVILVPQTGLEIKGDNLEDAGTRDVQGMIYRLYNGSSLKAGESLALTISGRLAGENLNNSSSLLVGLGALGMVLILAGVWLSRRYKFRAGKEEGEEIPDQPAQEPAETIMDAILTLDDLYQAGELPKEAYIQRRNELKARLRQTIDQ